MIASAPEFVSARVPKDWKGKKKNKEKELVRVRWRKRREKWKPPSGWFPAVLPKYEDLVTSSKEAYHEWAWDWEEDVDKV